MARHILRLWFVLACLTAAVPKISLAAISCDQKEEWCPLSAGPINTWGAPVCGKNELIVQPFFFYNRTRGNFDSKGHYKSFKNKETKSQYKEQLFLQYGLTNRLEIGSQGAYQQQLRRADGQSAEAIGFDETYVFARYCLIEEKGRLPHLTALFQLKLPTGKYQKVDEGKLGTDLMGSETGGGSYDHSYGVNLTKKLKPFVLHADFIYNIPILTKVDGVKIRYSDYINYNLGIEYFLPKGFNLMVDCNSISQGDRREDGALIPASDYGAFSMAFGAGWSCKSIQTLLAYQRTLAGTNAEVKDSIIFTFVCSF